MFSFSEWLGNRIKFEYFGGKAGDPSGVNDEDPVSFTVATGGGSLPIFGNDRPITKHNRRNPINPKYCRYLQKK